MPAWIVGIQVRSDAPETSMSGWIPPLHAGMTDLRRLSFNLNEAPLGRFSKERTKF